MSRLVAGQQGVRGGLGSIDITGGDGGPGADNIPEEKLADVFAFLDKNDDGFLDKDEVQLDCCCYRCCYCCYCCYRCYY
jgi:hypothetical protein